MLQGVGPARPLHSSAAGPDFIWCDNSTTLAAMFPAINRLIRRLGRGGQLLTRRDRPHSLCALTFLLLLTACLTQSAFGQVALFEERFENGNTNGWTMGGADDTADQGTWEIGDPVGTFQAGEPAQPESGNESVGCAFTAQNTPGNVGFHDVDKGVVYLVSPVLDLSGYSSVELSYFRWYFLDRLNEDVDDYFVVQARDSVSSPWVELERLDNSARANAWIAQSILLETHIDLTSNVQIRFGASDGTASLLGNIVEAAVDDVLLVAMDACQDNSDCNSEEYCSGTGQCLPFGNGDVDLDGDVDIVDYRDCLPCIGSVSAGCLPCNLVGSDPVEVEDLTAISQIMSGPNG